MSRSHARPWFAERRMELAIAEYDRRQWAYLAAPWTLDDGEVRYTVQRVVGSVQGWSTRLKLGP